MRDLLQEEAITDEIDEAVIRSTLNTIIDPCSHRSGVPAGLNDMGLVRKVAVTRTDAGTAVRVSIGVTESACLMALPFCGAAYECLRALPGVEQVEVTLDTDFDWSPDLMQPEYRARLEAARTRRFAEQKDHLLPILQPRDAKTQCCS